MKEDFFVSALGTKRWLKDGKLHREGAPAVIYACGTKEWYKDGLLHRENGPAAVWADGTMEWWLNGEWFRTCLPEDKNVNEYCEKLELDIKPTKYLTGQIVI